MTGEKATRGTIMDHGMERPILVHVCTHNVEMERMTGIEPQYRQLIREFEAGVEQFILY